MGLVDDMDEESECIEAFYKEYIDTRKKNKIYIFFEGVDDYKYYWSRLSPYIGSNKYKKYVCKGKENVLKLYYMIKEKAVENKKEIKLYFVDRDYDEVNNFPSDIYVTPTYSIENLYVSDSAFKSFLMGEWRLSSVMSDEDEEDYNKAFEYLKKQRDLVINSMLYANAWYSLQKKRGGDKEKPPKLSAIKRYDDIKNVYDKSVLEEKVPYSVKVSDEDIEKEMEYLKELPVERIRGKYFEQTMHKHFTKIINEGNKRTTAQVMFNKRHKVNINVGEDNMVSVLSNYADVPRTLTLYIHDRLSSLLDI